MPKLLITREDGSTVTFPLLVKETLIGRLDSAHLVLEDPTVSRVHAKIVCEADGIVLVDLESRTGTHVNGTPVLRCRLADGDVIEIASTRMEYRE